MADKPGQMKNESVAYDERVLGLIN